LAQADYTPAVDFIEFKFWKLVAILVVVGVVVFFYRLITGRSLAEDWTARKEARSHRESDR